ncbi:MAG: type IV secretory system conjugative DNA transfer family protein, partial [Lachnospiraceae bacterium]|nr:type IV secretory system conjugative DNA transfer family protein [Lachnospiraceae bacterium]
MRKHKISDICWREVHWHRPYEQETVWEVLSHLAALSPRGAIIWEIRGGKGTISYLLGAGHQYINSIEEVFAAHGDVQFSNIKVDHRTPMDTARQLKISHPSLSLRTDITEAVVRAGLATLTENKGNTETVLQIILGRAYAPSPVPNNLTDPHASWLSVMLGNVEKASAESRKTVKEKAEQQAFQTVVRIGSNGDGATARCRSLI